MLAGKTGLHLLALYSRNIGLNSSNILIAERAIVIIPKYFILSRACSQVHTITDNTRLHGLPIREIVLNTIYIRSIAISRPL
jgi:hypothetical protein